MRHEFQNNTPETIDAGGPNTITSSIEVSGTEGRIRDVNVTIDVDHTWTNDLEVYLVAPNDQRVLLVSGEGGGGDNFRETKFDDAATATVEGASAPFRGTFRPEESLTVLNNLDPSGAWTLEIKDRAFQDGGSLKHWALSIETGSVVFENRNPVTIDPGPANTVSSSIEVTGLGGSVIEDVDVTLDVEHTWDQDLTITLIGPDGTGVILVDREGGRGDNFGETTFDDDAATSITDGSPPFSGTFRPEGNLTNFDNKVADGIWTLEIRDRASQDGGSLNSWSLALRVRSAEPSPQSEFHIQVNFLGGLTASQRSVFELAAARWSEIITGDLPDVRVDGVVVDDVSIDAQGRPIDGPGRVLGSAGPTVVRSGSLLPARGIMSFDTADLDRMESEGSLIDVIVHEMGHVLGIGTLWSDMGLLEGAGSANPIFTGENAKREYAALIGSGDPTSVPVANTGGPGTRDGHWRETTFDNELMTGIIDPGVNPVSRVTIAALEDMGYEVNYGAADNYVLPNALRLARMARDAAEGRVRATCSMGCPVPVVLPESAIEVG